jgi:hypothetical protein
MTTTVVCSAKRDEHPIGNGPQVLPVPLESLGQPVGFRSSVTFVCRSVSSH